MLRILYFTAPWCGPCKTFGPLLEQFAKDEGFELEKINVENEVNLTQIYGVMSLPTTVWLREDGGVEMFKVGALSEGQLEDIAQDWGNG